MEVGAVKQAFNNELIKLKKNLNQAKIQIIHKLTRKAKTLTQKKAPEHLQEKLKRKSESAINEVLIIKKTKVKDLAHFMLSHKEDLNSHLNKPQVDTDKACARLLLHKSLNDRYKFIRDRFGSVPINDLLMSRQERQKLKKEAKEKKKKNNKKKGPNNFESNELDISAFKTESLSDVDSDNEEVNSINGRSSDIENGDLVANPILGTNDYRSSDSEDDAESEISHTDRNEQNEVENSISDMEAQTCEFNNSSTVEKQSQPNMSSIIKSAPVKTPAGQLPTVKRKAKDTNKNKNLNEKLLSRKFKKDDFVATVENKVVDPFFKTESGENYLTVAEPRKPDEFKEVHKQGNRRLRRAEMFGHALKYKPKRDNFKSNYNNTPDSRNDTSRPKFQSQNKDSWKKFEDVTLEPKVEKLHPSWEAKKKLSTNLPFQGKKIVFDDS